MTKIDAFWNKAFAKYNISEHVDADGVFKITAVQIKAMGEEARLVTKFDNASELPKIFIDNGLTILPITRGSYIIAPLAAYFAFPEDSKIFSSELQNMPFPDHIQSLDSKNISSEAAAISCAYISGILDDFIGDENLKPTISGRMSSDEFDFDIANCNVDKKTRVKVAKSQLEIDGGYEGVESFTIIEAKKYFAKDFIIRQLYYPLRLWSKKIDKQIKTVFLVYADGIFYLYEYEFKNLNDYNSLELKKLKRYSLAKLEIQMPDIENLIKTAKIVKEPDIPFPQADSFLRIIDLCNHLQSGELSKHEITEIYGFNDRQTNYYVDAARYLGLIDKNKGKNTLTDKAKKILALDVRGKQLELAKTILSHRVFKEVLNKYLKTSKQPSKAEIVKIMKECGLYNVVTDVTYNRRASTISSWVNWILSLVNS